MIILRQKEYSDTSSLSKKRPALEYPNLYIPVKNGMEVSKYERLRGNNKGIDAIINKKSELAGGRSNLYGPAVYDGKILSKSKILKDKTARKIYDHGKFSPSAKLTKPETSSKFSLKPAFLENFKELSRTEGKVEKFGPRRRRIM